MLQLTSLLLQRQYFVEGLSGQKQDYHMVETQESTGDPLAAELQAAIKELQNQKIGQIQGYEPLIDPKLLDNNCTGNTTGIRREYDNSESVQSKMFE
jgi:hypothetical protein